MQEPKVNAEEKTKRAAFHAQFSGRLFGSNTVLQIAEAAGVTRNTADSWKNQEKFPDVYEMFLIAAALNVAPGELCFGATEEEKLARSMLEFIRAEVKEISKTLIQAPAPPAAQSPESLFAPLDTSSESVGPEQLQTFPKALPGDSHEGKPRTAAEQVKRKKGER